MSSGGGDRSPSQIMPYGVKQDDDFAIVERLSEWIMKAMNELDHYKM